MLDVMLAMQPTNTAIHAAGSTPNRVGNRHPISAPFDTYAAADGLVVIAVANDKLFGVLTATLGKPELLIDPRFATDSDRSDNDEALRAEIEEFTTGYTVDELCAIFDAAGVPNSPVLNFTEAVDGPITDGRGLTATDERTGHTLPAPTRSSSTAPGPTSALPVPHLGEHNDGAELTTQESTKE